MRLVIFAGTSEGRALCERISRRGAQAEVCVATEYGRTVLPELRGITVHSGRMDEAEMTAFLQNFDTVVDATHPYADVVTRNLRAACAACGCRYLRLLRPKTQAEGVVHVPDAQAAAEFLNAEEGGILLTTGSKDLPIFAAGIADYKARLFPRVLPAAASLEACQRLDIPAKNMILMQGPFSAELNAAMLRQTGARWLVTKDTGAAGGLPEKLAAARETGAGVVMIDRPTEEDGLSSAQIEAELFGSTPRFPLFLDLTGAKCVIVGAGSIARRRVETWKQYGAEIVVIAPDADRIEGVHAVCRPYEFGDLEGAVLASAATNDRAVNRAVGLEAKERGIPVSVADCAEESTFYFPAVCRSAHLSAGVVSDGTNHKLTAAAAKRIRAVMEEIDL